KMQDPKASTRRMISHLGWGSYRRAVYTIYVQGLPVLFRNLLFLPCIFLLLGLTTTRHMRPIWPRRTSATFSDYPRGHGTWPRRLWEGCRQPGIQPEGARDPMHHTRILARRSSVLPVRTRRPSFRPNPSVRLGPFGPI